MDQKLKECLCGQHGSYILPFLWLHGEPKERVREEILAIKNSGIREFCAESRPYEAFCKEAWWEDFGYILATAKELGMRVWLLDDRKFPTGYANGYLEMPENARLRKRLIREFQIDAVGPMKHASFYLGGRIREEEQILSVVAYRRGPEGETMEADTAVELTDALRDGMVYWDVPEGVWRLCVTVETAPYEYRDDRLFYYIDMLSRESCHAMIDAVYQPHYEHFSEYFGNTFAGFFSDEPGFLNVCYTYNNRLGQMFSPYPWREDLPRLMAESAGVPEAQMRLWLPALWEDIGEVTPLVRTHYMEVVTKLYRENFSYLLGDWCRDHGVMYIGHVIEDMGAHMRLGYGSGHYFRALDGQDMAGIDIVLMQDIPGLSGAIHRAPLADGGKADPAFFRYTLPKLAASHAHIQPLKQGRAMCEIFGAFGWAEGLPFMKGLADIMLASGINYFVPHAFSPKEEDTDCPPHFYNGGKNVQYPLFGELMTYMGRCSHLLSGGKHRADVAVFYNAESEWAMEKDSSLGAVCRELTRGLIDFDIVPYDALAEAEVQNGRLCINGESYGALVVPESPILPIDRLTCFHRLSEGGLPLLFVDALPERAAEGAPIDGLCAGFATVPREKLPARLRVAGLCHVAGKGDGFSSLRFYHVEREGKDVYLLSNEDLRHPIDGRLTLPQTGDCLIYDPWANRLYRDTVKDGVLSLHLDTGSTCFLIFGEPIPADTPFVTVETHRIPLPLRFDISVKEEGEEEFRLLAKDAECFDLSAPDRSPRFSGLIRYEAVLEMREGYTVLDLGQVGETAEIRLNGRYLGACIHAPYRIALDGLVPEENRLEILVRSNLAHRRRDEFSGFHPIPPTGILGPVFLCKFEKRPQ